MNYKTFRNIVVASGLFIVLGVGWCTFHSSGTHAAAPPAPSKVVIINQSAAAPVYAAPSLAPVRSIPTVDQLRADADQWLGANARNVQEMKRSFSLNGVRATAIRFPERDAAKFTSSISDWSQLRFDLNGDGRDDEKWLLKNGRVYKREALGSDGKSTVGSPQWFW